jgi:phosphocarrier protein HPr
MPSATVKVGSTAGLHARPASVFVAAVAASDHDVSISFRDQDNVDASSLLSILTLGVEYGDEVTLHVDGDRARDTLNELSGLLQKNLD